MKMAAMLDVMALTNVRVTLKPPLVQIQCKVAHKAHRAYMKKGTRLFF